MVKVHPEGDTFPRKIVYTECDRYPPEYIAAKERVDTQFCTLGDGRKLSYFTDGDKKGVPVICMHGGSEGKWMFLQKEPIPGVYMVSIDRMGYGESDVVADVCDYTYDDVADDIRQLADHLVFEQFVLLGFSIGTSWAQECAAHPDLQARIRGIILFGTMSDSCHPRMGKDVVKKVGRPPGCLNPHKGCCGCILRNEFVKPVKAFAKYDFAMMLKYDHDDKRCAPRFQEMTKDHFWICCKVDSCRSFTRPEAQLGDAYRTLFRKWPYDVCSIKCPVCVFQGEFDSDMGSSAPASPEFVKRCVPHAEVEFIPGCGHASTFGPVELTRSQIIAAVGKMPEIGQGGSSVDRGQDAQDAQGPRVAGMAQ